MVRRIERYFGYRPLGIDPFFYSQRRSARLRLTHQSRMPRMRWGIEREPIERITTTGECCEFCFVEIGQQPARCHLSCCCARVLPFTAKSTWNHFDCTVVELPQ